MRPAKVTTRTDGAFTVTFGDHRMHVGGDRPDYYCSAHRSAECIDTLNAEEREALGEHGPKPKPVKKAAKRAKKAAKKAAKR